MTLLDLKAPCQPARENTGLRPVSPAVHSRKTTSKQNSFNRVLDKASQFRLPKNEKLNGTDQSGSDRNDPHNAKSLLKGNFESPDTVGLMTSKQETDLAQLEPEIPNQDNLKNNQGQEASSLNDNSEQNDALVSGIFQLIAVVVDQPDNESLTLLVDQSVDQSTDMLSENETQIQAEPVPIVNSESLISVLPSTRSANQETDKISPSLLAEETPLMPLNDELKPVSKEENLLMVENDVVIPEMDAATLINAEAGKENQLPPDMISPDSTRMNQPDSGLLLADSTTETTDDLVSGLTAQFIAEKSRTSEQQAKQNDAQNSVSVDEEGNTSRVGQEKKVIIPEDIRVKLLEKYLVDKTRKPSDVPPATDVKKLLGEEIERLRVEKSSLETSSSTEPLPAKTQPEVLQPGLGAEKLIFNPAKSGVDAQMTRPEVPTPTVDPQDLIEQIVKKVEVVNKAVNSEIKIQLKPEFLGKIMIKIAVDEGVVTARFITESQQVKHLLENNLGTLKQNLESQGLKVDRTEVNVQLDNGGAFHGNDSGRQQMWQEYAERNSYNHLPYEDDYGGVQEISLESYGETASANGSILLDDGKLDFMI